MHRFRDGSIRSRTEWSIDPLPSSLLPSLGRFLQEEYRVTTVISIPNADFFLGPGNAQSQIHNIYSRAEHGVGLGPAAPRYIFESLFLYSEFVQLRCGGE